MPKVSVIIPVYNVEKYLRECLDSVVNQTLSDIEIICVNDGSTDNSLQILQEYAQKDNRIKVINQENRGSASARNKGMEYAQGEYIGFVDSDDYISHNYYKDLYKTAHKMNADISATNTVVLCSQKQQRLKECGIKNKILRKITSINDKAKIIITTGVSGNKIYKKKFLNSNKIECLEIKNPAEDNYFTDLAVICANRIAINNNAVYYYNIHENTQTQTKKTKSDFAVVDVYNKITDKINSIDDISQNDKDYWKRVINWRKHNDYRVFFDTMLPKYKESFKEYCEKDLKYEYIVSLTSYPARINTVNQTIESLLKQTMKPQKITLWLAQEQFPNGENDLPQHLIDLEHNNFNFFIEWCEDIKSYKKLIPALEKYPDSVIVTADDDLIYENDWLEKLYKAYKKHPEMIHCHRAHRITFDKQKHLNDYSHWVKSVKMINPSFNNFFTGGGGVLYPSHSLYKDVLNKKLFLKLAPTGDDIWFWAMAVMNNRKINIVKNNQSKLHYIEGTQENCLYNENIYKNDEQIRNVLEHYPNILEKLNKRKYREPFDLKTFLQNIFSIKNEISNGIKHKVITILGIKIKFKRRNNGK